MRNSKKMFLLIVLALFILNTVPLLAKVQRLLNLSANTWVENHHGDRYLDDTYIGKLSINGSESYYEGSDKYFPIWVSITYDVQGDISKRVLHAKGSETIKDSIVVKDKWNNGPKTRVFYNYDGVKVDNSIDFNSVSEDN